MTAPSSLSNARYQIPDWFLECNVKTPADLSAAPDRIVFCNCADCKEEIAEDDGSDADLADEESPDKAGHDVEDDGVKEPDDSCGSSLGRELCTDKIRYSTFAKLRDMTAAAFVTDRGGKLLRPEASAVVFRVEREETTTYSEYDYNKHKPVVRTRNISKSCMEPVWMGRAVERVAKALGVSLVTLDPDDLEELGCEFYHQDKEAQRCETAGDAAIPFSSTSERPKGDAEAKHDGSTTSATSMEEGGNKFEEAQEAEDAEHNIEIEVEEAQEAEETQEAEDAEHNIEIEVEEAQEAEETQEAEDAEHNIEIEVEEVQEAADVESAEDVEDNDENDSITQQQWEPDVFSLTAFLDYFFAARTERKAAVESWQRTQLVWTLLLDAVRDKLATERASSEIIGGTCRPKAVIFHITDYPSLDYFLKRRVLARFAEMVQQRRKQGDAVVMIVSTQDDELKPERRLQRKIGATKASTADACIAMSDADLAIRKQTYQGTINARALRRCLRECCAHLLPADLLRVTEDWASAERGKSFRAFGRTMWTSEDMDHIVIQIMGRAWVKPELKFADIRAVLNRRGFYNPVEPEAQDAPACSEKAESKDNDKSNTTGNASEDNTSDTSEDTTSDTSEDTTGDTSEDTTSVKELSEVLQGLDLNWFEKGLTKCVVDSGTLKTRWDDVIIDQETKELMQQFIASHRLRFDCESEFLRQALRIRGALLYGHPGTGKTELSRAVATASGSRMLAINSTSVISEWAGESEKYIQAAFTLAGKLHPCVLFIDEVDSLFYRRSSSDKGSERSLLNQFLHQMDGLTQNDKAPLVLVATNRPWDLDEAFLRRLQHKVYLGLPDIEARARILGLFLHQGDLDPTVDLNGLAQVTEKYSGSDLKTLCAKAGLLWEAEQARLHTLYNSVSDKFAMATKAPGKVQLGIDHFVKALDEIQPSNNDGLAEDLQEFLRKHNPTASISGKDPGIRFIYNSSTKRHDRFDVRALISRLTVSNDVPAPKKDDSQDELQLQTWCQLDLHAHLVHCLHIRMAVLLFYSRRILEHQMQLQDWCQMNLRTYITHRLHLNLTALLLCLQTHPHSLATMQQAALESQNSTVAGSKLRTRQKTKKTARKHKSKLKKGDSAALDSENSTATGSNLNSQQKTENTARRSGPKLKENASAAETARFCYTTLGKDEYRLLEIAPGEKDAPLVCTLKHTSFQSKEWYCALSYTWGSPEPPFFIKCDGSDMRVTRSLHGALHKMRRTWRHVLVWADAICINQSDNSEKSQQVMRMCEIYAKASRLFIWLGNPVTASDADVAVRALWKLHDYGLPVDSLYNKSLWTSAMFDEVWQKMNQVEAIDENESLQLRDLFLMPWFSRVWIFQEVASVSALSRYNILVGYGNCTVSWLMVLANMAVAGSLMPDCPLFDRITAKTMYDELVKIPRMRNVNIYCLQDGKNEGRVAEALARKSPPDGRNQGAFEPDSERTIDYIAIVIDTCKLAWEGSHFSQPDSGRDAALMLEIVLNMFSDEFRAVGKKLIEEVDEDMELDELALSAMGSNVQCEVDDDDWWLPGHPIFLGLRATVGSVATTSVECRRGPSVITIGFKTAKFSYMPNILRRMWSRMQLARRLEATDLRDKVYAFLGMFGEEVADEPLLQVDYSLSVTEVYINLTIYFLQRLMCLDVLEFVNDMPTRKSSLGKLPSWAIDLTSPTDLDLFDIGMDFNAGGAFELGTRTKFPMFAMHALQVDVSNDRRRLNLNAFLVGEVTELGFLPHHYKQYDHLPGKSYRDEDDIRERTYSVVLNMINNLGQSTRNWERFNMENPYAALNDFPFSAIFRMPSRLYLTGQRMFEVFWRCLGSGHMKYQTRDEPKSSISRDESKVETDQVYREYGDMLHKGHIPLNTESTDGDQDAPAEPFGSSDSKSIGISPTGTMFHIEFGGISRTRVCGVVADELIGWFPRRAQKGDMLAILPGARCPYVLRRVRRDAPMDWNKDANEEDAAQGQEQRSEWEVIGYAYVEGLMHDIVTEWRVDLTENGKELLGKLRPSGEPPDAERICLV